MMVSLNKNYWSIKQRHNFYSDFFDLMVKMVRMRYISPNILSDLEKKIVFLTGPRQAGKTTLALELFKHKKQKVAYFNWDDPDDRKRILQRNWGISDGLIVLDEIHKYPRWKNFLKGTYDNYHAHFQFLITGSARLDIYKKGQDSLMGRHFSWHLHPFCLSELKHFGFKQGLADLMIHGGFPEALLTGDETFSKRWRRDRLKLVFNQDIRELEHLKSYSLLEIFHEELKSRTGQLIVLSNIARDLEIAPKTAKIWLEILARNFTLFTVRALEKSTLRSLSKPVKVYFFDNGEVEGDEGAKFENLVANHLYKKLQFLSDSTGDNFELNFIRDKEKREVDFVVTKNKKPLALIEVKLQDEKPSKHLLYFKHKLKIPYAVQVVLRENVYIQGQEVSVVSASDLLSRPLTEEFWKIKGTT